MVNESDRLRVLMLTPVGRDSELMAEAFFKNGITSLACQNVEALAQEIQNGAGIIVIAEEALTAKSLPFLSNALQSQPPWSDMPSILLSTSGESTPAVKTRLSRLAPLGNVTVIERPVRPATLISVVKMALRARHRQYEVEGLLKDLQVAQERLRTMIESAYDYAIINLDLSGRITYWNAGAERLLRYAEQSIIGQPIDLIFSDDDRRAGVPAEERERALKTGLSETEGWRGRKDGSRFWASGVLRPTRDAAGNVTGFVKVLRDMTQQRHAEERLAEQARALKQSNDDLQRFAYVASHDLQEPLRTIGSYSQLLVRRNEAFMDADSHRFVDFIVKGVERMRLLIKDLLEFSHLTTAQTKPLEPVDCDAVLGQALQYLQLKITELGAHITFERLPNVMARESGLLQVFQNLIGNALKYCRETPEIHISAERDGDHWRIAIRDNGIGIESEYHERIFGLFQRLHSSAEYPGTGIGLATCKRIIEQNGGRIWVESTAGSGSVFYFTLPASEPEHTHVGDYSTAAVKR